LKFPNFKKISNITNILLFRIKKKREKKNGDKVSLRKYLLETSPE